MRESAKIGLTVLCTVWCVFGTICGSSFACYAWSNGHGWWGAMTAFLAGFFGWPLGILIAFD